MTTSLKEQATGPMDRLKAEARGLAGALGARALSSVQDKIEGASGRLTDYVEGGGGPGLMAAVTGAKDVAQGKGATRSLFGAGMSGLKEKVRGLFGKGGGRGGGRKLKLTNIVESIDIGAPRRLVYDQWTQFSDFPRFMKKLENVDQASDEGMNWKAQVFWSHRTWEATIIEQVPDSHIVWRSKGQKGHVDGAVSFHEVTPDLTRVLLVLEYHPQGMFERTGNVWRAQGRRARLELKHFRRHVMTEALLRPDEIEGWRGEIRDSEVVKDQETALAEEQGEQTGEEGGQRGPEEANGEYAEEADYAEDGEEAERGEESELGASELGADAESGEDAELDAGEDAELDAEAEDEEPESDGQRADGRGRPADAARGSGGNGGRTQRSGGSGRAGQRPERAARRTTSRGGEHR
jgi:Polyketide cyclase / dehydrase and lipid transport